MGKTLGEHIEAQKALEAEEAKTSTTEVVENKSETENVSKFKEPTEVATEEPNGENVNTEAQKKSWRELQDEFEIKEIERLELEELKQLKDDAFVKEYRAIKKAGGDIKAFVNAIADIDDSMISDEVVFKKSLASQELSEYDLDEAWHEFKDQKDYIKNSYLETERIKIKQGIEEKRKNFGLTKSADVPSKEIFTEARQKLERLIDGIANTEVDGVFITPEMALELAKTAPKFFVSSMNGLSVDVSDALETAFAKMAITTRKQDLIEQGKTKGLETAFAEKHNPNATQMVSSKATKMLTKEQQEDDAFMKRYGIKQR